MGFNSGFKELKQSFVFDIDFIITVHLRLYILSGLFSPVCLSLLYHASYITRPLILHYSIILVLFNGRYNSRSFSLYSFLQYPVTPSLLFPDVFLSTLLSTTLSICSSFSVRDQVSHPDTTPR